MSMAWRLDEPYDFSKHNKNKKNRKNKHRTNTSKKRFLWNKNPYCYYCKVRLKIREATVDHVIPLSKGGSIAIENCVLACSSCNVNKGNKLI